MSSEAKNFPTADMKKVLDKNPNRFLLSVAVAKRARQIKEGSKPHVDYDPDTPFSPVQLALKEYELGFFDIEMKNENHSEDEDLLKSLEQSLEDDLASEEANAQPDDKKNKDSKSKPKSKSLAA